MNHVSNKETPLRRIDRDDGVDIEMRSVHVDYLFPLLHLTMMVCMLMSYAVQSMLSNRATGKLVEKTNSIAT